MEAPAYPSETAALRAVLGNGAGVAAHANEPGVIALMCHEDRDGVVGLLGELGARPLADQRELLELMPRLQARSMTDPAGTTTGRAATAPASLGAVGVWSHLDTLTAAQARAYAARVEALGFGTLWVPETVGRDPFTSLGLLAAETSRMALGTSIASMWARDAQTTRMAAHTLDEATGGRFVLGLGVSHPHLAERLRGHVYERPLAHMRDYLAAYARAVYKGPMPADGADPPILAGRASRAHAGPGGDRDGRRVPLPRDPRTGGVDPAAP